MAQDEFQDENEEVARLERLNDARSLKRCRNMLHDYDI
jgi:hypothetical protein